MEKSAKVEEEKSQTIKINIRRLTDSSLIVVELDPTFTPNEIIQALISSGFIHPDVLGYGVGKKGGSLLAPNESLVKLGVKDGDELRIIPATDAG